MAHGQIVVYTIQDIAVFMGQEYFEVFKGEVVVEKVIMANSIGTVYCSSMLDFILRLTYSDMLFLLHTIKAALRMPVLSFTVISKCSA